MKLLIIFLLFFNLYADSQYKLETKYGFLAQGTLLSYFKDARVALKSWVDELAEEAQIKVDVAFYTDEDKLYEDLKNKTLDMIVVSVPFYFKYKKDINKDARDFWSINIGGKKFTRYYLVANNKLKQKGFSKLKNRTLSLKSNDSISKVWLDKNSLEENKKLAEEVLKTIKYEKKESSVLLNVFFGKSDYAIVKDETWDTMIELNPSIQKRVELVSKMKIETLPFIGIFSNGVDRDKIDTFFDMTKDLNQLKGYGKIAKMLKIDNYIVKLDEESLAELSRYYSEYYSLKDKYK